MRLALVRGVDSSPELQRGFVRVEIVGLFDPGFHYTVSLDRLEQQKNVETIGTLYSQHPTSPITLEVMIDSDRLRPARTHCACANRRPVRSPSISAS